MNFNNIIKIAPCLCGSLFSFHSLNAVNSKNDKPNIIFIMADDLGYGDLGCYGQKLIKTPNIDKLASEGIRFTQAYAGGPVSVPSRSVLMTGLHNGHTPARDNVPHYSTYLQDVDITIAEVLKNVGYRCGGVGKWSLGDAGTVGEATNQGFDMWLGYLNQDHAHYYYPEYLNDSYRIENGYRIEFPKNTESRRHYSHGYLTERSLQFIRDSYDVPFFLYVAYTLPHFSSTTEDKDRLTVPSIEPYSLKEWDIKSKKYAAMIHILDVDVGRIINLVDDLGIGENTLIIFTSDNGGNSNVWSGFNTNAMLRGYKGDLTEGGIRVPFIARWTKNVPKGKISDEIIAFQDIMPTFTELAGAKLLEYTDGISIVETLLGKHQQKKHEFLYWDYGHCRKRYDQAVRYGDWKGIRLGLDSEMKLYNITQDIGEKNNIANNHPEIVKEIEKIMKAEYTPSKFYPIGEIYNGRPLWNK